MQLRNSHNEDFDEMKICAARKSAAVLCTAFLLYGSAFAKRVPSIMLSMPVLVVAGDDTKTLFTENFDANIQEIGRHPQFETGLLNEDISGHRRQIVSHPLHTALPVYPQNKNWHQ